MTAEIGRSGTLNMGCDIWVSSLESLAVQVTTVLLGHRSHLAPA
jgi:hypothetical protein